MHVLSFFLRTCAVGQRTRLGLILLMVSIGISQSSLALSEPAGLVLEDSAIKTLAASCAACHGPHGNSVGSTPTLAGLNSSLFIQRMQGFKDGSVPATVMHRHAKGLREDEIAALAQYFAQQPRITPPALPKQPFKGGQ